MNLMGHRLADAPINKFPVPYEDLRPGDYWLCQTLDGTRLLNVRDEPADRLFWGGAAVRYDQNLTGLVLGVIDPLKNYGMLCIHTVRLDDPDDPASTISVRPGDGSSNSILIKHRDDEPRWHGFIEHGMWHGAVENGTV
jgi:hypothetical protein